MWPSIDHSILSPSGKVSKRARNAALERARKELFPKGLPAPTCPQSPQQERDLRVADELETMAARGMHPRKYRKEAERLRALYVNRTTED